MSMIPIISGRISPHFMLDEFTQSETAEEKKIKNIPSVNQIKNIVALCKYVLEPVRKHFQKPIFITSGYRSKELNKAIGGSRYSQHMKGEAADFVVKDIPTPKVFDFLIKSNISFDQCINELKGKSEWIHISHRRNRREKLIATFENGKPIYREVH